MSPRKTQFKLTVSERISKVTQQWFLTEPLLFGAWTTHQISSNKNIDTIRVGRGKVEYNPGFLEAISDKTLREVMKFESLRIILKHPYERKKSNLEFSLTASNIAIDQCLPTSLPMPTARSTFDTDAHDNKYFEFYYNLLIGLKPDRQTELRSSSNSQNDPDQNESDDPNEDKLDEGSAQDEEGICECCGGDDKG
jgi:predicted metal-dependent peptidase